jgi:hypothetical protein
MLHGKSGHFFSCLKCVLITNQLWASIYGLSYANMVIAYKSPNRFSTKMNSVLDKLSTSHVTMNVYNKILNFFVNGMNLSMKETNKILNTNIGTM